LSFFNVHIQTLLSQFFLSQYEFNLKIVALVAQVNKTASDSLSNKISH